MAERGGAPEGAERLPERLRVLVCTDVWVDYLTDRNGHAADIVRVFEWVERRGGTLLTAVSSLQDIFSFVASFVQERLAQDGDQTSEASRRAVAWECIRLVRARSAIVGADLGDCFEAEAFRSTCCSLSDALTLAAVRRGKAHLVLSEQDSLRAAAPVPAYSVGELVALLGVENSDTSLEERQ